MKRVFAFLLVSALLLGLLRYATLRSAAQCSTANLSFQTVQNDENSTQNSTQINVTQPSTGNEIDFDRTYYVPTTITLNFPSTTATSLSNVSTVSGSGYNYAGDDHSFTFIAKIIDVYSFTYTINYANASMHDILIATWEGDRAMQGETWASVASTYVVSFRLSMVAEPAYPSATDVAQQSLYQFQQLFQQLLSNTQSSATSAEQMSIASGIASTIAAVTSIIVLVFYLNAEKKRRRMQTETG